MTPELDELGAVVVLHKAFPQVLATIEDVIREGVAPTRVLVVNNSEDDHLHSDLVAALPPGVRAISIPNAGYANAVNVGVRGILDRDRSLTALLVLTHEVRFAPGAVETMRQALVAESVDAVGPLLVDAGATRPDVVWSAGGSLSRWLRLPSHLSGGRSASSVVPELIECDWLDGSVVLYRSACLTELPLNEKFFLYFEELEQHTRLRLSGRRVVVSRAARASQSSHGVPANLLGRNLQLFQFLHGTRFGVLLAVPYVMAKSSVKVLFKRVTVAEVGEMARGWRSAWREKSAFVGPVKHDRSES